MIRERIIPINDIPQGARVALYGAGEIGKRFLTQARRFLWCDICMVVDTNYNDIKDFPVSVESPKRLLNTQEYDFILISIVSDVLKKEVLENLINMGIERNKIIDNTTCFFEDESYDNVMVSREDVRKDNILRIAFLPSGMMGDNIISLKLYQELVKLAPESKIDVFTPLKYFPEKIFWGQYNLNKIFHQILEAKGWETYDLVIESNFEPSIVHCNLSQIKKTCTNLAGKLEILYEYQRHDLVDLPIHQFMNRIRLERARLMGWNRYTLLGCSGAFDIKDQYVDFYINSKYREQFQSLGLRKKYITYNFGASDPLKNGKQQTKVWPYEYHAILNKLLKERFPKIEIVQLGGNNARCVPGTDRCIFGEDIETVKYILKNSIYHFDCESGLVHMATQLGTKCFVVFGPTPVWFFGYDRNVNIAPKICGECKGLIKDWYTRCYRYKRPECMYSIKPDYVFSLMEEYLIKQGY